jgi:RNA ligase
MDRSEILKLILEFNIEVVKQYPGTVKNMQHLIDITKPLEGVEGFVVRFEDGHMLKVKADQYVLLHKSKDELQHEKNVVAILVENKADDFRVLLSVLDRAKFELFEMNFWKNIEDSIQKFTACLANYNYSIMNRKEFALKYAGGFTNTSFRSLIFKFFDNPDVENNIIKQELINIIKKNTGSQSAIDKVREVWDGSRALKWNY